MIGVASAGIVHIKAHNVRHQGLFYVAPFAGEFGFASWRIARRLHRHFRHCLNLHDWSFFGLRQSRDLALELFGLGFQLGYLSGDRFGQVRSGFV